MTIHTDRMPAAGAAVVMACACGAASNSARLLAPSGIGATAAVIQPALIGVGAALIIAGLWSLRRGSAYVVMAAFALMAVAALLLPQHAMVSGDMGRTQTPWSAGQMSGAALYAVAAAMLAYAFWRAYPSVRPQASATAFGGMALATGCACCLVTGATAGAMVTMGAGAVFQTAPILFWVAMTAVAGGLFALGGAMPVLWTVAGALTIRLGLDWINRIFGEPSLGGINPFFVPKYLLMLAGYAMLGYAFAVAYAAARQRVSTAPAPLMSSAYDTGAD